MSQFNLSNKMRRYALIVDGEYVTSIVYPETREGSNDLEIINAALQSNPTVVDITGKKIPPSASGWLWDGTNFNPPQS